MSSVTIQKNDFDKVAGSLRPGFSTVVQKTGFDMVTIEQTLSRVDEGTMRAGWSFEMTGDVEGVNYNPVAHTVHNEYGTATMTAQPMMHPALDQVREPFNAGIAEVMRQGKP